MSGNKVGTTASSTDSGQGTAPLSDAFVAVVADPTLGQGSHQRVAASIDSSQLLVTRRSTCVAAFRSRSTLTSASAPSVLVFVDAPPRVKRLSPVGEDRDQALKLARPAGNVSDLLDIATPQLEPLDSARAPTGCKHSATSAALVAGQHGPAPKWLGSAADFLPTHFLEPVSNAPVPLQIASEQPPSLPSSHQQSSFASPMKVEPDRDMGYPSDSFLSPISHNFLLQRNTAVTHTPSPPHRHSASFQTQDSAAAWAAAEGLRPITENFTALGYVPAHIVVGISYTVRSPQAYQPAAQPASVGRLSAVCHTGPDKHASSCHASVGRQLFANYMQGSILQHSGGTPIMQQCISAPGVHLRIY